MGNEYHNAPNSVFLVHRENLIKVGDEVKLEIDEKGFYRRIWVNGELKTNDHMADVNGRT